ncbi:MAG TPA: hypothetical protein VFE33_21065 [Thermoanaerobaculia bacterium]|nr:hypothetical protein [Thermoanaerobaculia bacterium]
MDLEPRDLDLAGEEMHFERLEMHFERLEMNFEPLELSFESLGRSLEFPPCHFEGLLGDLHRRMSSPEGALEGPEPAQRDLWRLDR